MEHPDDEALEQSGAGDYAGNPASEASEATASGGPDEPRDENEPDDAEADPASG